MAIKQLGGLMAAVVGVSTLMLAAPTTAGAAQSCTVTPQSTVGCDFEDFNGHHRHHGNNGDGDNDNGGGGNNNGGGNNGGGGTPAPTTFSAPPATATGVPLRCGTGQALQFVTIDDPNTPGNPDHFVTAGNINPLYAIPSGTTPAGVFVQAGSDLAASTGAPVATGNVVTITCA